MGIVIFVFYAFVIGIIIVNIFNVSKAFKANGRMFDNIEEMARQRYNSVMQNNMFKESNKINTMEKEVNLDDFMKSNTNPVKEKRSKRSKI